MKLVQIKPTIKSKGSVPAGKAKQVDFGVIGVSIGIEQPNGDTSRSDIPMPKYKTFPGQTQGTK